MQIRTNGTRFNVTMGNLGTNVVVFLAAYGAGTLIGQVTKPIVHSMTKK